MRKLLQLITDIENLEDFIKICIVDGKIDNQTGKEILRLTRESITLALKD